MTGTKPDNFALEVDTGGTSPVCPDAPGKLATDCGEPVGEGGSLSATQLQILQHSLGVDQYGRGEKYRSHFVTSEGSLDHPDCLALVEVGMMTRHKANAITGGMDAFTVTEDGKLYVDLYSSKPPKLTRSQQRYQDWIDADCNMTFGEWQKRKEPQS